MSEIGQNMKNPLANIYFGKIYKTAVKISKITADDSCLDFGCGNKRLRDYLPAPFKKYQGYDSDKRMTTVKDYHTIKPTMVFALNVLEHLTDREIEEFAKWIKKAAPKRVIVSMPCENFVNRAFNFITGREFVNKTEHVNHWINVNRILLKYLKLKQYKRVYLMQWVSLWAP